VTQPPPDLFEAEAVQRPPPPRFPPSLQNGQIGYHRLCLALAVTVLAVCLVLPAPGANGNVRLLVISVEMPPLCTLKRLYGIDCPGCEMTRCFLAMAHLQVAAAWTFHPVGVVLFVAVVAQVPYRACQLRRLHKGRSELKHWTLQLPLWLLVAAILGQWALRMTGVLGV
jgi:hypothetical protein